MVHHSKKAGEINFTSLPPILLELNNEEDVAKEWYQPLFDIQQLYLSEFILHYIDFWAQIGMFKGIVYNRKLKTTKMLRTG